MLKLLNMQVEGFCSIPQLYLPFNQNQIVWIRAANGCGKSSIFSALIWCLYGKTIKGVSDVQTWKEVRPKDYCGAMVSVIFQKNDSVYQVIRCQKYEKILEDGSKGKDRFIVIKDADPLDIKGKIQLQQKLVDILGLTQNLFTNSVMFGQGLNRIIQESNSDKKKLFEEIFDLNYLNIAKGIALEDKGNIVAQLNEAERESANLKKELEANKTTYKELRGNEKNFANQVRSERKELRGDRKRLNARREEIISKMGSTLLPEITKLQSEVDKLNGAYHKAKRISNIPIREFIGNVYDMLQNKKYQKASEALQEIMEAFSNMETLQAEIDKKSEKLEGYKEKQSEYREYSNQLTLINEDLEDINEQLRKLKESKLKVLSPKYKAQIEDLRHRLRKVDEDYHNKELELEDYNWVIDDPLGNNGIKAYLFDSSLDFLNRELERYSEILGFHIAFEIDLSTTRKEFCTLIEKDNHVIDYDELSGGEKQLVDISMAFAMNQALSLSKGINLAFLDEVFESLSSDNIELVIQLVREVYKDKTLFLISHHESLPFSNVKILEVEKRNGLSYYKGL